MTGSDTWLLKTGYYSNNLYQQVAAIMSENSSHPRIRRAGCLPLSPGLAHCLRRISYCHATRHRHANPDRSVHRSDPPHIHIFTLAGCNGAAYFNPSAFAHGPADCHSHTNRSAEACGGAAGGGPGCPEP